VPFFISSTLQGEIIMHSQFQNYLTDAVEAVLTWDIPEEDFSEAVRAQACLMAGINPDELLWFYSD
jgi:hypothetical protein